MVLPPRRSLTGPCPGWSLSRTSASDVARQGRRSGSGGVRGRRCVFRVLLDKLCDDSRPPGLVTDAKAGARIAVKIFVEQDEIAPMRVSLELFVIAINRTPAVAPFQEQLDQPVCQIARRLPKIDLRSRPTRVVHFEVIAEKKMVLLQRLDKQEV